VSTAKHIYLGLNDDRQVRAKCLDDKGEEADTAATIKAWIDMGRTVIRMTVAAYDEMDEQQKWMQGFLEFAKSTQSDGGKTDD